MPDYLRLKSLTFFAHHGVMAHEQEIGQRFEIDVELAGDLSQAGNSDDVTQTYNYDRIYRLVESIVTGKWFNLIEALAEEICAKILAIYPDAVITVTVRKPHAPLPGLFSSVEAQITRGPRASGVN